MMRVALGSMPITIKDVRQPACRRHHGRDGGARKLRFKRPGMGKSGGYRIISYFPGDDMPVFLLNVFTKGERANLSKAEQNTLRVILANLADSYTK